MQAGALTIQEAGGREAAEALIRACLRGEAPAWPGVAAPGLGEAVLERCGFHGVAALVYRHLGEARGWPEVTVERLRDRAAATAMWEMQHQRCLARLLAALAERGIAPVLMKGTALAYACYPDPALRTRGDTDLLVPPAAREAAGAVLGQLGFAPALEVSGDLISYQAGYQVRDSLGLAHAIDLHWRVNNSEVLSRLFSHAELRARAAPLPALGPGAVATCPVDALLLACMHRQAHRQSPYWVDGVAHFSPDRLIWLYDLHLLAGQMTAGEWTELVRLAREKGLAAVCHEGLSRAGAALGTALPPGLLEALEPGAGRETPHAFLHASASRQTYMNFRALVGIGPKLRYMRELLFPPASYMRARYAGVRPAWLPWLYARRAVRGSARRLRGSRAP